MAARPGVNGLRRILRSVADQHTYWLATTDARERAVKRLMKQLHGGNYRTFYLERNGKSREASGDENLVGQ